MKEVEKTSWVVYEIIGGLFRGVKFDQRYLILVARQDREHRSSVEESTRHDIAGEGQVVPGADP